jgi:putative transposase
LLTIQQMLRQVLALTAGTVEVGYCLLDGFFGHNSAVQMVRQCQLHLISKLRYDAVLYRPFEGPQPARGPKRKYGSRVDPRQLPESALRQRTVENGSRCAVYQLTVRHKSFADLLNVVIIQRFQDGKQAHIILFSSDLALTYQQIIDYCQLRFQLEFNFRDAKQYWGLDDFMTVKPHSVNTSVNLALFMPNVAHALRQTFQQQHLCFSVNDLKAHYRGLKYVHEVLNLLPHSPDPISIESFFANVLALGSVNIPRSPS